MKSQSTNRLREDAQGLEASGSCLSFGFFLGRAGQTSLIFDPVDGHLHGTDNNNMPNTFDRDKIKKASCPLLPTLKRKCLRWSGPMSATCWKTGGCQCFLVHSSCRIEMGCLPWKSWMSLTAGVGLMGAISSLERSPFLSILMSSERGSKVPSLLRPSPSPGCQPIFCSNFIPTPPANGAALENWSFLTHACRHVSHFYMSKRFVFPSSIQIKTTNIFFSAID